MLKTWTLPDTCLKFEAVAGEASSQAKVFITKGNINVCFGVAVIMLSLVNKSFASVSLNINVLPLDIVKSCC